MSDKTVTLTRTQLHDIRGALSAISMACQAIASTPINDQARTFLEMLLRNATAIETELTKAKEDI